MQWCVAGLISGGFGFFLRLFFRFHFEMRLLDLSAVPSSQLAFSSVKSGAVFSYSVLVVPDHF